MATEIWRDFDPNLAIPIGLVNTKVATAPDVQTEIPEPDADIDPQFDTLADDDSELDIDSNEDVLGAPASFEILSQTVRTGPDGKQVVDVVVDVEDIEGAENYEFRLTK